MSFLPPISLLLAYLVASALLSATPGPDMALFLQKTLAGGRRHGFAALAGAQTGILAHTCAAALGLSALIAASAQLYGALKILGALYLVWLAIAALRHGSALRFAGEMRPTGVAKTFATGVLINLTNPKIILFFVTFLPQFIEAGDPLAARKFFVLGLIYVALSTLINAAIIGAAARFVATLRVRPRILRAFDYAIALLMGAFAVRLLASGGR